MRKVLHITGIQGGVLLCLALTVFLVGFGLCFHKVEDARDAENDQYVHRAAALLRGELPADRYRPLFYPLLAAGAGVLAGDPFIGAEFVSAVAAGVLAFVLFLWVRRFAGQRSAVWSVLLLGSNAYFWMVGVYVTTDMLFAALSCLAVFFAAEHAEGGRMQDVLAAALFSSLAYFTRYAAVILLPVVALAVAIAPAGERRWAARVRRGTAAAGVFLLCLVPHMLFTLRNFGAPFHNENWKNMAYRFYGADSGIPFSMYEFSAFDGILSVLQRSPVRVLVVGCRQWIGLFEPSSVLSAMFGGGAAGLLFTALLLVGTVRYLFSKDRRRIVIAVFAVLYSAMLSFTFWPMPRLLLPLLGIGILMFVEIAETVLAGMERPVGRFTLRPVSGVYAGLILLTLRASLPNVAAFEAAQPRHAIEAAQDLQEQHGTDIRVMGTVSFTGHYVDYSFRRLPRAAGEEREDAGMYYRSLARALDAADIDFVIVDEGTLLSRPAGLLTGAGVPAFLVPENAVGDVRIYRVVWEDEEGGGGS